MRRALVALAVGASLAGCAGGDELSTSAFRERSAEICRATERKLDGLQARGLSGAESEFWSEVEEIRTGLDRDFDELELSGELRDGVEAWLEAGRRVIEVSRLAAAADVIADEDAREDVQRRLVTATREVEEAEERVPLAPACTQSF